MLRVSLVVLGWLPLAVGEAQSVVRGTVRERTSARPIVGAEVLVEGGGNRVVRAGKGGGFTVSGLPGGSFTIRFRALGFRPLTTEADLTGRDTLELDVELDPTSQRLDPIAVASRPSRRQQGLITSAEIQSVLGSSTDGYDLVRQLRPSYLRGRGASSLGNPTAEVPSGDSTGGGTPGAMARAERTAAARSGKLYLPKVSVDDGPLGELESLRQIPASTVREIRFLSSIDAATRFGAGVEGGVILVTLR